MLSNHEIADMNYCRRCINQKYNIHLKRSDVVVLQMMYLRTLRGDEAPRPSRQMERPVETSGLPTPASGKNHKKRKSAVRELPRALLRVKKTPILPYKDCRGEHCSPLQCIF